MFRPTLLPVEKETEVVFKFSNPEDLAPPIFQLDEVGFHYVSDLEILHKVDLSASMASRICVVRYICFTSLLFVYLRKNYHNH